jgi:hypothetical protein
MAIIYSYPTGVPTASTLLLGSAHDPETGANITKQFSIGAIADVVATEIANYRSYVAYLNMDGTTVVPTVLFNDLNGTITFVRTAVGTYECTISGVDNFDAAWYSITNNILFFLGSNENYVVINKTSSTIITIYTYMSGVLSDNGFDNTPLEIKIFD